MPYGTRAPKEIEHPSVGTTALPTCCFRYLAPVEPDAESRMHDRGPPSIPGLAAPTSCKSAGQSRWRRLLPYLRWINSLARRSGRRSRRRPTDSSASRLLSHPDLRTSALRETLITQQPNVYSVKHRFSGCSRHRYSPIRGAGHTGRWQRGRGRRPTPARIAHRIESAFMSNPDELLVDLCALVESEQSNQMSLTVVVGGAVITGRLAPEGVWRERVSRRS